MPYPVRTSPHLGVARQHAAGWARQMGFFESVPGLAAGALWDERRFAGFDFAHCAAMIHADAGPVELGLSSDWLGWGTYADDYYPRLYQVTGLAGPKLCDARLPAFMPLDGGATPEPANPVERGLADLWRRTVEPMALDSRAQFRRAVTEMTSSWLWELANQAQNRIPDPVDYVEMRRRTFGSDLTMSLARLTHRDVIAPEIYQTRVLHELDTAAQDYACFTNDLFSYQKEIEFEGEVHNLVLVLESFLSVDRLAARDIVADLMAARMREFEHLVARGLPALCADLDLDDVVRDGLLRHADDLKDWMSGILEWHRRCARYTAAELRRARVPEAPAGFSLLPSGPGTSAASAFRGTGRSGR
jgi:germacradienol/geosmin synthase